MRDLIWFSEAQMLRIEPHFPLSHSVPRVDDRRIISGVIFVVRYGLRWRNAPVEYDPGQGDLQLVHPLEPHGCVQQDLRGLGCEGRQAGSVDCRRDPPSGLIPTFGARDGRRR